jgi:N-acyl-D-aspartate/D-glutamate deacylase
MFDLIIKNGTVIDGTGSKGAVIDVGIEKDKITAVEKLDNVKASETIDASGKIVCPGFVDLLDHSDSFWTLFTIPRLDSKVMQGITTIIGGNCGSSLTPILREDSVASIQKWVDIGNVNINWSRPREFFRELSRKDIGVNFGTLVGHETLRRGLVGDEVRKTTEEEIKMMGRMLFDSLEEGIFGMSTGLVFSHAKMATTDEIKYLAEILKSNDALYTSHIRGESEELLPSVNETIQIGREIGVSVEISHLKAVGEKYWPDITKTLEMINIANEEGVDIDFDIYPYDTTGSVLYTLLPDWVSQGGRKRMISKLKDFDLRDKIIREMKRMNYSYENIVISICPKLREVVGRKIMDIAKEQEMSPEEVVMELLISANGHVIVFDKGILSEENIKLSLKNSHSIVASGDAGYNIEYTRTGEIVHPRCFGTFPRILGRYVREQKVLSLESAVEKMTSKPAEKIGIKSRGRIKKGFFADVVVFDAKNVIDKADYNNPYQYPEGIEQVIINGRIVVKGGQHTGELAGKVLRKK